MTLVRTEELIASVKLPEPVREALDDTYFEAEKREWLLRYALTGCKRRRATMVYLLLRGL